MQPPHRKKNSANIERQAHGSEYEDIIRVIHIISSVRRVSIEIPVWAPIP